jgi:hypothetical protein
MGLGGAKKSARGPAAAGVLPLREVAPLLDTGDVVLFGGSSALCMRLKRLLRSQWSHVAMIIRVKGERRPLLWEAVGSTDMVDLATGEAEDGVRLVSFPHWVSLYHEDTVVRRLAVRRSQAMLRALDKFRREMMGRPYDRSQREMLRAAYDGFVLGKSRREDLSSVYCAELVAAAYQRMGLLPDDPPSNEYTPKDFSTERRTPLPLRRGAALGEEVRVGP